MRRRQLLWRHRLAGRGCCSCSSSSNTLFTLFPPHSPHFRYMQLMLDSGGGKPAGRGCCSCNSSSSSHAAGCGRGGGGGISYRELSVAVRAACRAGITLNLGTKPEVRGRVREGYGRRKVRCGQWCAAGAACRACIMLSPGTTPEEREGYGVECSVRRGGRPPSRSCVVLQHRIPLQVHMVLECFSAT